MSAVPFSVGRSCAARVVLAWVRFYTRDVAPEVAILRRAELESDVWEQVHDRELARGGRSAFLLWRAARSVPADLAWRSGALRATEVAPRSLFARWEHSGLSAVVLTQAFLVAGLTLAAIVHVLRGGGAGTLGGHEPATVAALALTLLGDLLGVRLAFRRGTRWLGSLLIGGASVALLIVGAAAMVRISTTAAAIYYTSPFLSGEPSWRELSVVASALLALFNVTMALSWLPSRRAPDTDRFRR